MTARRRSVLIVPLTLLNAACVMMPVDTGASPKIELLETALEVGRSPRGQALEILGPPDGVGRIYLPRYPEPRTIWSYFEHEAGWEEADIRAMALFFDDEVLTGFLWYTAEDVPASNAAPQWLREALESQ